MAKVRWTLGARRDPREIISFTSHSSVIYAALLSDRIIMAADSLEIHPMLGRTVPEFEDENIR